MRLLPLAAALLAATLLAAPAAFAQPKTIDWVELIPEDARDSFDAAPPPPNQLVYVKMSKGISLDSMYSAYWITGKMSTQRRDTTLGAAAYTLAGTVAEEYKF